MTDPHPAQGRRSGASERMIQAVETVIDAMHDPALGLERSVRLRHVVEALRSDAAFAATFEALSDDPLDRVAGSHKARSMVQRLLADFIEREFTTPRA